LTPSSTREIFTKNVRVTARNYAQYIFGKNILIPKSGAKNDLNDAFGLYSTSIAKLKEFHISFRKLCFIFGQFENAHNRGFWQ
jgi:hypothetical protein